MNKEQIEDGEINDSLGVLDKCQIVPLFERLKAENAEMREALELDKIRFESFALHCLSNGDLAERDRALRCMADCNMVLAKYPRGES